VSHRTPPLTTHTHSVKPDDCTKFTLKLSDAYHAPCEAACRLLRHSGEACGGIGGGNKKAEEEVEGDDDEKHAGPLGEKACMAACRADEEWGWQQTKCLEQAVWSGKCNVARRCVWVYDLHVHFVTLSY
jgi:hypothetical protein